MASGAHYPNGISTRTLAAANSAAGAGDLECVDIFSSGNIAANGTLTGTGTKQYMHIVQAGSGAITSNVTFPYDVTITDVIFGCTSVGSSASGLSGTIGTGGAALFTSTTAFVFASASGFQHVFTTTETSLTVGANSTGYLQFIKAAGAATAIDYYVMVGFFKTAA